MSSVLLSILVLLALLLGLLAIPLSLSFSIIRNQQLQGYARFRWLFGLVNFQASIPNSTKPVKHKTISPSVKSKSPKSNNSAQNLLILFKQQQFRQHIIKLIKNILRATHAKDLYLRLRIGLGDPADTGMLWAVIGPLSGMMKNLHAMTINIEPEFIESVMEIESHGRFKFIPLQFITLMIVFLLSPMTIRAWRAIRQAHQ